MPARVPRIQRTCLTCAKSFERMACELKRPNEGRYCSVACRRIGTRKSETFTCASCKKSFDRASKDRPLGNAAFCSRACWKQHAEKTASPTTYRKRGERHEHRIVAEQKLGRPLRDDEIVHHIDGNRRNNDPNNLEVMTQSEHLIEHGLPTKSANARRGVPAHLWGKR